MSEKVVRELNEIDCNEMEAFIDLRFSYQKVCSVIGNTILSCNFLSDTDKLKVGQNLNEAIGKIGLFGVETDELAKLDENLKCFIFDPDFDQDQIKMLIFRK